ncbi:MAG: hypothetical protein HC900_10610 [Methylacidiphilales bacterium]|nr:hypothetical protein [Candidatus Methylacidiphilales bacterium]
MRYLPLTPEDRAMMLARIGTEGAMICSPTCLPASCSATCRACRAPNPRSRWSG